MPTCTHNVLAYILLAMQLLVTNHALRNTPTYTRAVGIPATVHKQKKLLATQLFT
jgi:hypothetical protein